MCLLHMGKKSRKEGGVLTLQNENSKCQKENSVHLRYRCKELYKKRISSVISPFNHFI